MNGHYDEEKYKIELDRIENIYNDLEGYNKKHIYYTEDEFNYPAYVACNNKSSEFFEYVLLNNENKNIIYIMIQYKNTKIFFDEE